LSPNNTLESGSALEKLSNRNRQLSEVRKNFMDVLEDEREVFSREKRN
jgi:hypothetical protein